MAAARLEVLPVIRITASAPASQRAQLDGRFDVQDRAADGTPRAPCSTPMKGKCFLGNGAGFVSNYLYSDQRQPDACGGCLSETMTPSLSRNGRRRDERATSRVLPSTSLALGVGSGKGITGASGGSTEAGGKPSERAVGGLA